MKSSLHAEPDAGAASARPPAEAFFLAGHPGERYCLYHPPAPDVAARGALVYVHPFGEEMNKCRRMAALQSRAFARSGHAVLQIDLYGCGDSSGDFGDARWEIWKDDLARAHEWLRSKVGADRPIGLWGMRLGALLAMDVAGSTATPPAHVLLWQPVLNGETYLNQFLRMRAASEMLAGEDAASAARKGNGNAALRNALAAGESLEVGGYLVAPELAAAIDRAKLAELGTGGMQVHWFEVVAEEGRDLPPAAAKAAAALRERGIALQVHLPAGPSFWASQEIAEAPHLLTATTEFEVGVPA